MLNIISHQFSSVQSLSHVQLFATPWTAARKASLFFTTSCSLLKLVSIESVMPSNHLILCRPLLLPPSVFPSIRVFSNQSGLASGGQSIGVSASVLSMNIQDWFSLEFSGWISLQSKGLLSLLQHHSSKVLILQHSALFIVQLSHLYMTTGKTIALTRRTFVAKVMSLLFNMLSRLVIAFLPRSISHQRNAKWNLEIPLYTLVMAKVKVAHNTKHWWGYKEIRTLRYYFRVWTEQSLWKQAISYKVKLLNFITQPLYTFVFVLEKLKYIAT